jgi:hypothetical protein
VLGLELPYQLYLMLPYAMAIVALVLVARRAAYPQALMKPARASDTARASACHGSLYQKHRKIYARSVTGCSSSGAGRWCG